MINKAARNEAQAIAGGLYSMNARTAKWYAFTYDRNGVTTGEFVWSSEGLPEINKFDAYITLKTGELKECKQQ